MTFTGWGGASRNTGYLSSNACGVLASAQQFISGVGYHFAGISCYIALRVFDRIPKQGLEVTENIAGSAREKPA